MSERTLFVKLSEPEVLQIRALSVECHLPMEEVVRRMVVLALKELEAESRPIEKWEPEF